MSTSWKQVSLGEVCKFKYGQMPKASDLCDSGYPVFSGYRIVGHANKYHYERPEIIVVARGVGGTGDVKMSPPNCFLTNLSIVAQVISDEVDQRFLYFRLSGPKLWELRTGSAQAQITIDRLQRYALRLPPVATQRKIASVLGAYDELIENNRRRIEILEEMARRLYREWFVQFRFPGHAHVPLTDSPLGKIPKGWEVKTFDDLMRTCSGFAFKSATFQPSARYKVVTIKNVQDGSFLAESDSQIDSPPSNMPDHCHLESGDILLSLTGNVGRACFVFGRDFLLNQRVAKLVPHQRSNRGFVYFTFRCEETQTRLEMISNGVAQQNLSPVQMGKMPFVIPADDVLKKFSAIVEPICDHIVSLNIRNRNLQTTRDLLLPRLISGELDVSELPIQIGED